MVRRGGQETLEQREQKRHLQRAHQLAADAAPGAALREIALRGVLRQHLPRNDARQRKHHGQLPAHADEQDEGGGLVAHRPQRIPREVPDDAVGDLVEPVHAVQREPRPDGLPVLVVDLRPVDVEHHGQDEDEGPVEVVGTADHDGVDEVLGGLRAVSPELEHGASFVWVVR